jgi:hypothetical protein
MSGESGSAILEHPIIVEDQHIGKATNSPVQGEVAEAPLKRLARRAYQRIRNESGTTNAIPTEPAAVRDTTDPQSSTEVDIVELKRTIEDFRLRTVYDGDINLRKITRPGQRAYMALHAADPDEFYEPEFFTGLDNSVALQLIEDGQVSHVAKAIEFGSFELLDAEVARRLIKARCANAVTDHLDIYQGVNLN